MGPVYARVIWNRTAHPVQTVFSATVLRRVRAVHARRERRCRIAARRMQNAATVMFAMALRLAT